MNFEVMNLILNKILASGFQPLLCVCLMTINHSTLFTTTINMTHYILLRKYCATERPLYIIEWLECVYLHWPRKILINAHNLYFVMSFTFHSLWLTVKYSMHNWYEWSGFLIWLEIRVCVTSLPGPVQKWFAKSKHLKGRLDPPVSDEKCTGCQKKTHFQNAVSPTVHWLNHK